METGGKHTGINDQIICNFNSGLGFEVYGVNPLKDMRTPKKNKKTKHKAEHTMASGGGGSTMRSGLFFWLFSFFGSLLKVLLVAKVGIRAR